MKKETPILFKTDMVKAILEGRKTMTRRVMKVQLTDCSDTHKMHSEADWKNDPLTWSNNALKYGRAYCALCGNGCNAGNDYAGIKCPYGKVGDVLWVKETWAQSVGKYYLYATNVLDIVDKWKPSLFMPKVAARLWLEITDIKVERLQDISEKDAINEGINTSKCNGWEHSPVQEFQDLWQSINGEESWEQNPFVWCVSFKVFSTTGKPESLKKVEAACS